MNKKKGKGAILLVLCIGILCSVMLCFFIRDVQHDSDDTHGYYVLRINGEGNAGAENYYFSVRGYVLQFSIPEQEITGWYSPERELERIGQTICTDIDTYAIGEGYIFMSTGTGNPNIPVRIWKYDMETDSCKLFMETSGCSRMEVYDGFLLFGQRDIYICPVDGNPEEDCISLFEQFPDGKSVDRIQKTDFRGWQVWSYWSHGSSQIEAVVDVENNSVILPSQSYSWFWTGEEWVIFDKPNSAASIFYYQWEKEPDRHLIDCLSDSQYRYSDFRSSMLTWEGGKIIGLLTVSQNPENSIFLEQYEVKNDLLFEIELETDTSSIIYSTKNNKTRIIGYRDGVVYLLKDDVIYQEELGGGEQLELLDLQESGLSLYTEDGRHQDLTFDWWGDNLIIRQYGSTIMSISVSGGD